MHRQVTIRITGTTTATTAGMSAGDILAAAHIRAAVDVSAVEFAAVAEAIPAAATAVTGRPSGGRGKRQRGPNALRCAALDAA
jgi:hypothetical protein